MEFELITKYFQSRPQNRKDVVLGVGDDCALLKPPTDQLLVMSTDTMVENIHFTQQTSPLSLGHKSLAVSLSDLAAMGAEPAWVLLSLSLEKIDEAWLSEFCEGFFALADQYRVSLVGGNMTSGALSITTQVTGFIPPSKALRRDGAKVGDKIYVTGCLGDAALALMKSRVDKGAKRRVHQSNDGYILQKALDFPTPRIEAGLALRNIANSAIDISDGLVADLGHVLEQSHVGGSIDVASIPLSDMARGLIEPSRNNILSLALSGGDDYELCFTVSPENISQLEQAMKQVDCRYTCIGEVKAGEGLEITHDGQPFHIQQEGYQHWRD